MGKTAANDRNASYHLFLKESWILSRIIYLKS